MWMKTIQQDLKSSSVSLNEAIDVAQNRPLWRCLLRCALLVLYARKEEEEPAALQVQYLSLLVVSDGDLYQ